MRLETISFEGHESVRLEDESSVVIVTTSVGPRVLGLVGHGDNLMAVLPEAELERPDGQRVRLIGGHRLWVAPEVPDLTYQPDDHPCVATEIDGGVRVEAPVDGAGLVKALEVRRGGEGWIVDHELRNSSGAPLEMAPWAVTQLRLGGDVVLPIDADGVGPQANRSLVLWPYTDPGDVRIRFGRDEVWVHASPGGPRLKLGVAPSRGRVAYRLDGEVFEKGIDVDPAMPYPDRGAAVQVYLCDEFCELETLGPLRVVREGERISHRETWSLRASDPARSPVERAQP